MAIRYDLSHPINLGVVEYLRRNLTADEREWPHRRAEVRPAIAVPIGELCTHPDLGERLRDLLPPDSGALWGVLAGKFVLRSGGGILFGLASGMHFLALRTGPVSATVAARVDARPVAELAPDWLSLDPWNPHVPKAVGLPCQRELCAQALALALRQEAAAA